MPTKEDALIILDLFRTSDVPVDNHTKDYIRAIMYRTLAYTIMSQEQRDWLRSHRIVG